MNKFPNIGGRGIYILLVCLILFTTASDSMSQGGQVNITEQDTAQTHYWLPLFPILETEAEICDWHIDSARRSLSKWIRPRKPSTYIEYAKGIGLLLDKLKEDSTRIWEYPELTTIQNLYVHQGAYFNSADRFIEAVDAYHDGMEWSVENGLESENIYHFIYGDQGTIFNRWGELEQAELFLEKSLNGLIELGKWGRVVKRMRDFSILYQSKGELHLSLDILADGLKRPEIDGELRGGLHEATVGILLDTFELSQEPQFLDMAKLHADSALWYYRHLHITDPDEREELFSTIHWLLGKYHSLAGDLSAAEPYFLRSIKSREKYGYAYNRGLAKVLVQYGDALMRAGKYQKAALQYQGMIGAILPSFDPVDYTELPDTTAFYPEHSLIEGFQGKAAALLALYRENQDNTLLIHAWKSCQAAFQAEDILREKYVYNDSKLTLASEDHQRMELSLEILFELWQMEEEENETVRSGQFRKSGNSIQSNKAYKPSIPNWPDLVFQWAYQIFERNQSQLLAENFKEMKGAGLVPEEDIIRERRLRYEILFHQKEIDELAHDLTKAKEVLAELEKGDANSGNPKEEDDIEAKTDEGANSRKSKGRETTAKRKQKLEKHIASTEDEIKQIRESIRIRGVELSSLRNTIRTTNSRYYAFRYSPQIVPLDRIEKYLLNDSTGLIEYFRGERAIYRLTLQPGHRTFTRITNVKEISESLQFLTMSTDPNGLHRSELTESEALSELERHLHTLHRDLWPSSNDSLPLRLLVIPDDTLWQIPFEGLLTQENVGIGANAPYLIHDHSIFYSFSASSQFWLEEIRYRPTIALSYQGFRPSFSEHDLLALGLAKRDKLNRFVGKIGGDMFEGREAIVEEIYRQKGFTGILHIVSHAFSDLKQSLNSYIAFEGEGEKLLDSLTLGEIITLEPQASLVVLEACESGTGQLRNGEGMESIARGFFISGSHSVICAGWEADKVEGEKIVDGFLTSILKKGKIDLALREAKLDFLESDVEKSKLDPRIWGVYKLLGSTRPPQIPDTANSGLIWLGLILLMVFILWRFSRE